MGLIKPLLKPLSKSPVKVHLDPSLVKVGQHTPSQPTPHPTPMTPPQPNCDMTQVCVQFPFIGPVCVEYAQCHGPITGPVFN